MPDKVCLGEIVGTHGVRGELKIRCFTELPTSLTDYGPLFDEVGNDYLLTIRFVKGDVAVVACPDITNPEDGKKLRGTKLYVARGSLPETEEAGGYYIDDLVGLSVEAADGKQIGTVKAMHNFGAGDIVELAFESGKTEMFSFSESLFPEVDILGGRILFHAPDELTVTAESS